MAVDEGVPSADRVGSAAAMAGAPEPPRVEHGVATFDESDSALYRVAPVILRHRRVVLLCGILTAALVATVNLLVPRTYTAHTSFIAKSSGPGNSGVAGLAAQFGVQLEAGEAAQSPDFYAELVRTRGVARAVVESPFALRRGSDTVRGPLTALLELDETTPTRRREEAIRWFNDAVGVGISDKTGVVRLSVVTEDAELSWRVAERLLAELDRFNLERRQSQAAAERRFAELRLAEVRAELRAAEDRQRSFLQNNRTYQGSPELQLRLERLQRDVMMHDQLFNSLAQAYEQAKLEEVRDTPLLTVLDAPELPITPDPRGLALKTLIGLVAGLALGVLIAFSREFLQRLRARMAAGRAAAPGAEAPRTPPAPDEARAPGRGPFVDGSRTPLPEPTSQGAARWR